MVPRFIFIGDEVRAKGLIYDAQLLLNKLITEMSFMKLPQLARTHFTEAGDRILVRSLYGLNAIEIESPYPEIEEIKKEEVQIPFILRLSFRGDNGKNYYLYWDVNKESIVPLTGDNDFEFEQPVSEDEIENFITSPVIGYNYLGFSTMADSLARPGVDWMETNGGVSAQLKIRLFSEAQYYAGWDGGYKMTILIDYDRIDRTGPQSFYSVESGETVTLLSGRSFIASRDLLFLIFLIIDIPSLFGGETTYYASVATYDEDLNGTDDGLIDYHTNELYYLTKDDYGWFSNGSPIKYFVSHGKKIYSLPNLPDDERAFWATKETDMEVSVGALGGTIVSEGRTLKGSIQGAFNNNIIEPEPQPLYAAICNATYIGGTAVSEDYAQAVPREIPNFWVQNLSSAITNKGRAIILEQYVTKEVFEWNGSPYHLAIARYDVTNIDGYTTKARLYLQKDVKLVGNEKQEGEAAYDYQWSGFMEIPSEVMDSIFNHPQFPEKHSSPIVITGAINDISGL